MMLTFDQLWNHQKQAVELFKNDRRLYLNWDTGTGKTIGALALLAFNGIKKALVIAPKSSHLTWQTENEKFNLNLTILTYEKFRNNKPETKRFDAIVCDEAHRLKNVSAKVVKVARELIMPHEVKVFLSGTPADRYYELYSQIKLLKPEALPFKSYTQFINEFYYLNTFFKPERIKSQSHAQQLKEIFTKHMNIVKREDVIELPDIEKINIKLSPFKPSEEDISLYTLSLFMDEFKFGQGISANMDIARTDKLDWVLDFIEDNPDTIVFSFFKSPVEWLKQHYKNSYLITGDNKRDFELALKRQDKPIFATYSLKEGANLQGYRNVVYLSLPLAYRDYEQSLSRVYRAGQKKKVAVYHLLQNSIDHVILKILNEKGNVHNFLRKGDNE